MAISHEDMQEIKRVLDDRYVLQTECDERQDQVAKKFSNDNLRIELMHKDLQTMRKETNMGFENQNSKLSFNNWLTGAVLGVIIAGVIGYIFLNFGG